jgi:hypothetical protein
MILDFDVATGGMQQLPFRYQAVSVKLEACFP